MDSASFRPTDDPLGRTDPTEGRSLTLWERNTLEDLLDSSEPWVALLRRQIPHTWAAGPCGCGDTFCRVRGPGSRQALCAPSPHAPGVAARTALPHPDGFVHILVRVREGYLRELEILWPVQRMNGD